MKKLSILFYTGFLFGIASACAGGTPAPMPTDTAKEVPAVISATGTPTASHTATVVPGTHTPVPSATPTLATDAWQSMPVIPVVSDTARRIYKTGQLLHNDPHAFSILGDCLSLPINLFGNYGKGPGHYNLGDYTYLQPVIDWFHDSFNRQSITLGDGFTTAAVLSPLRADPKQCQSGETPLICEFRIYHSSYALISLGTDDLKTPPDIYESRMRQIVEYIISKGVIPILSTKADNREGGNTFNKIVARLAYEYDVPLWNFWAAVQSLPKHGVENDRGHLTWADPNNLQYTYSMQVAVPVRNVTALETLEAVWLGVTAQ
jgi:hypothetical protein